MHFDEQIVAAELRKGGIRLDANESGLFARELENISARETETVFDKFRADEFVPIDPSIDPADLTHTHRRFTAIGAAKVISNYATDLPNIEEYGEETTTKIVDLGASYQYTMQDIRASRKLKRPLEQRKARIAREAIERLADQMAAFGRAESNITGMLNASGVPILAAGYNGDWDDSGTTGAMVLADLKMMEFLVWTQSRQNHMPNAMLFGTNSYAALSKPYSEFIGDSVLDIFLRGSKMITSVDSWVRLDLADAQGNGERAVVYDKNLDNLYQIKPVLFQSEQPQADNLTFKIPCHGRHGGVVVRRPLSMLYVDGLLD